MGFKHGERARIRRMAEAAAAEAARQASIEVQTETTPIETRVTALEAADAALDLRLDAEEAATISLDGRLDVVEPALTTAEADITALDGRLDTAETDITNLEAADVALDGRLDTEEAATVSLDGRLDTVEAALPAKLQWTTVPASASATGTAGQIAYESGWLYVAVGANQWERVAIATWT